MKALWAPWRMKYIASGMEDGCFVCRAFEGDDDRENLVLKRGETCGVMMNRYPYSNGHLMICPYRHVGDIVDLNGGEREESMDLLAQSVKALRAVMQPQGFNVGINLGAVAGASLVEHVHTHVVPRWEGDTNFMPVIGDVKIIPQALGELWDLLQPVLNAPTH
jgi:ATP adenylyltransferase